MPRGVNGSEQIGFEIDRKGDGSFDLLMLFPIVIRAFD